MGGLYVGFSEKPFWKLYSDMSKEDFYEFALSASAYVETMRELHLQKETA